MSEILDCRAVALEKKAHFRKDFFGIFEILECPFLSEHSQNVSVIKWSSTTYFFLTMFQSFRCSSFKAPLLNFL